MLQQSPHFRTAALEAQAAAPSLSGKCVEVIDVLTRLQGADMKRLASEIPAEIAALNRFLVGARAAALLVDEHQRRAPSEVCDV